MKLIKIDIIDKQIVKTFDDQTVERLKIIDLSPADSIKFAECVAMAHVLENEFLFVSINIIDLTTRVVFFFKELNFKEYFFDDLSQIQKDLFTWLINL